MGGAGNIPWSKALAFAQHAGIETEDEQDRFWRMIKALDGIYLEWLAEKQKTPPAKT